MTKGIVERLLEFNADRIQDLRARKFKNMRAEAFSFFRGSCHLFYEDWPAESVLNASPLTWVCGDLHLENFGSYLGDDREVYFDINDFDETALAPCAWDATRFITSLILAGNSQHISEEDNDRLCRRFLDSYFTTLAAGWMGSVTHASATVLVTKLMRTAKTRKRSDFLDERTKKTRMGRKFKLENDHLLPVTPEEEEMVTKIIRTLAQDEKQADYHKIHDIAFRIAGTGSLGIRRYVALIDGKGASDRDFILDIKEARCSALDPFLQTPQPTWENQASRVVTIQKRLQNPPPALLASVVEAGKAFIIREYQPEQDRVSLADWAAKIPQALEFSATIAEILAFSELRSAGSQGAAAVDELVDFGRRAALKDELIETARTYAKLTRSYFEQFSAAYDAGVFKRS